VQKKEGFAGWKSSRPHSCRAAAIVERRPKERMGDNQA
jgi:hypothetical protein